MEKKPNILAELTVVKEPLQALYLTEDRVLINGRHKCSIVDLTTNKETKRISDKNCWSSHIAVHPNKKNFAFSTHSSIYDHETITIYDAETGTPKWTTNDDISSIVTSPFNSLDNTIALCGVNSVDVTVHNHKTNDTNTISIEDAKTEQPGIHFIRPIISFHPTEPLMSLAWKNIYIFNLKTFVVTKKDSCGTSYHDFCEYSPDGSFIVAAKYKTISILDTHSDKHKIITEEKNSCLQDMAIHPNSATLLTLSRLQSRLGSILRYWNIKTSQLITKKTLLPYFPPYYTTSCLSFSPNGTKLMVVLQDKCIILPVPFKVVYQSDTKQKLFYFLFFLKNHLHKQDVLPHDIMQLLMQNLIEAFKR